MLERGFALNETPVEKEGSLKVSRGLLKWLLESSLSVGLSFWGDLNRVHPYCYSFRVKIHGMCNPMVN